MAHLKNKKIKITDSKIFKLETSSAVKLPPDCPPAYLIFKIKADSTLQISKGTQILDGQAIKETVNEELLELLNQNQSNWIPAVQRYFLLPMVTVLCLNDT